MKYVIIDKVNEFGYAPSKYADMFNMTGLVFAQVYSEEDKEWCDKKAESLNSIHGYHLEVVEYTEMLLYVIQLEANKSKELHWDNLTDNRMWAIIHGVEKLKEELKSMKADWCPLYKIPEKRAEKYASNVGLRDSGFVDGWNACIDEILGGIKNE